MSSLLEPIEQKSTKSTRSFCPDSLNPSDEPPEDSKLNQTISNDTKCLDKDDSEQPSNSSSTSSQHIPENENDADIQQYPEENLHSLRRLGHRNSTFHHLPRDQKLDVRATQRTFEGAYIRTALGQLSFALIILKIFSREFLPIGTVFTIQGFVILVIGLYRRKNTARKIIFPYVQVYYNHLMNRMGKGTSSVGYKMLNQNENSEDQSGLLVQQPDQVSSNEPSAPKENGFEEVESQNTYFDTSGPTVVLISMWSIVTYITLLVLLFRLD